MSDRYQQHEVGSRAAWRSWLEDHHDTAPGIWLVTWKKGRGPHVTYDEVVEEALAYGWVDSLPRKLDEDRSQLLITPRQPGSRWSKLNKQRVAALTHDGLMTAAGQAAVDRAKADGSWTALDAVEALEEPDDLRAALDADPASRRHWDAFPRSAKRGILEWILSAKRDETRSKRIRETAEQAAKDVRANQWRRPG